MCVECGVGVGYCCVVFVEWGRDGGRDGGGGEGEGEEEGGEGGVV